MRCCCLAKGIWPLTFHSRHRALGPNRQTIVRGPTIEGSAGVRKGVEEQRSEEVLIANHYAINAHGKENL